MLQTIAAMLLGWIIGGALCWKFNQYQLQRWLRKHDEKSKEDK